MKAALSSAMIQLLLSAFIAFGVIGGTEVPAGSPLHQSVVRIHFYATKVEWWGTVRTRTLYVTCSGALVRSQFIVTAAHCLHPEIPEGFEGPVRAWAVFYDPANPIQVRAQVQLIAQVPISRSEPEALNDIALFRLSSPAPAGARSLPMNGIDQNISVQQLTTRHEIYPVGFGVTDTRGTTARRLKMSRAFLNTPYLDQSVFDEMAETPEHGIAYSGDSGGPALYYANERMVNPVIVGVISTHRGERVHGLRDSATGESILFSSLTIAPTDESANLCFLQQRMQLSASQSCR